jgi:hypothetical protein
MLLIYCRRHIFGPSQMLGQYPKLGHHYTISHASQISYLMSTVTGGYIV